MTTLVGKGGRALAGIVVAIQMFFISTALLLAQNTSGGTSTGGSTVTKVDATLKTGDSMADGGWYTLWWVWVLVAVFIIVIVALTTRGRDRDVVV